MLGKPWFNHFGSLESYQNIMELQSFDGFLKESQHFGMRKIVIWGKVEDFTLDWDSKKNMDEDGHFSRMWETSNHQQSGGHNSRFMKRLILGNVWRVFGNATIDPAPDLVALILPTLQLRYDSLAILGPGVLYLIHHATIKVARKQLK